MYHVNPTTGNAGVCRAGTRDGCPFGTPAEHHENANDARAAFEARMSGETLQVHKKLYKPREDDVENSGKPIRPLPEAENRSKAIFKADKDELRRARAEVAERETGLPTRPSQNRLPENTAATRTSSPNLSKARFEFEKADLKYKQVYDLMYNDEYAALPSFREADLDKFRDERDKFAKELGLPTILEQEQAVKEDKRRSRVAAAGKISALRSKNTDQSVGEGTNRGRLNNLERDLLNQHEWYGVDGGEGEIPPKEVWELKRSTSQYQVDLSSKELKDLGVVSFVSSRDKKEKAELYKKSIASASSRLEEAERALANS